MQFRVLCGRDNPTMLLRKAGYVFQHHTEKDETSFVRLLARAGFPRFHIYMRQDGLTAMRVSIHLDMKRETYGNETRHHGEYDDDGALAQEVARLKQLWHVVE